MVGDLNLCQIFAKQIAENFNLNERWNLIKVREEHLDRLFDYWLMIEKPQIHSLVQDTKREKEEKKNDVDINDIDDNDMISLIAKMKRIAAMERDSAKA